MTVSPAIGAALLAYAAAIPTRIMDKIVMNDEGCWIWTGSTYRNGYASIWDPETGGSNVGHRVTFRLAHGPVPTGLELDHTCHTQAALRGTCTGGGACVHRACVNPDHLEPVTHRENLRRAYDGMTECRSGHPWPENLRRRATGKSWCAACNREQCAKRYQRRKAKA